MKWIHFVFPRRDEEVAAEIYQQTKSNAREGGGLSSAGAGEKNCYRNYVLEFTNLFKATNYKGGNPWQ